MKAGNSYAGLAVKEVRGLLVDVMNADPSSMSGREEAVQKLEQCKDVIEQFQQRIQQHSEHLPAPTND
jgi:type VII secretion effector (TIGR04197 family)